MPNGTRRGHMRNGHPVRATSIKGRKPPQKRLNAGARRRAQSKPLLYAAGTLAGLGALDAILTGRWGGALVLGLGALGFLTGHLVWSHHKKRQAMKPARTKPAAQRPKPTAQEQRREALEKARAAHQPSGQLKPRPAPVSNGSTPPKAPAAEPASHMWKQPPRHDEWTGRQCGCTKCRARRRAEKKAGSLR